MNPLGAFYEYHFLMQEVQKDFPELNPLSLQDFYVEEGVLDDKDIYKALNLSDSTYDYRNFRNLVLKLKKPVNATWNINKVNTNYHRMESCNLKLKKRYRIITLNDSFLLYYKNYMSETFSNVVVNLSRFGRPFEIPRQMCSDWESNKNDIVLVETTERFLDRFLTLKYPCVDK